jgi:hypothetical protein
VGPHPTLWYNAGVQPADGHDWSPTIDAMAAVIVGGLLAVPAASVATLVAEPRVRAAARTLLFAAILGALLGLPRFLPIGWTQEALLAQIVIALLGAAVLRARGGASPAGTAWAAAQTVPAGLAPPRARRTAAPSRAITIWASRASWVQPMGRKRGRLRSAPAIAATSRVRAAARTRGSATRAATLAAGTASNPPTTTAAIASMVGDQSCPSAVCKPAMNQRMGWASAPTPRTQRLSSAKRAAPRQPLLLLGDAPVAGG